MAGMIHVCQLFLDLRRRGYTPEAISDFCHEIGVSKAFGTVDHQMLEHFVREDLKLKAPRTMGVLNPLKSGYYKLPRRTSGMVRC